MATTVCALAALVVLIAHVVVLRRHARALAHMRQVWHIEDIMRRGEATGGTLSLSRDDNGEMCATIALTHEALIIRLTLIGEAQIDRYVAALRGTDGLRRENWPRWPPHDVPLPDRRR